MSALSELTKITNKLPLEVLQDVHRRMADWLASGGSDDDSYMYQQLRYAQRFVNEEEK